MPLSSPNEPLNNSACVVADGTLGVAISCALGGHPLSSLVPVTLQSSVNLGIAETPVHFGAVEEVAVLGEYNAGQPLVFAAADLGNLGTGNLPTAAVDAGSLVLTVENIPEPATATHRAAITRGVAVEPGEYA